MHPEKTKKLYIFLVLFMLGISGVVSYLSYQNYHLRQEKESLKAEIAETKSVFTSQKEELLENIEAFKVILAANQSDKNNLEQDLLTEREAVDAIEAQVQAMTGTVGTLKKLSETDKELLKKYSRVYFLNENYIPKYLFPILSQYVYEPEKEKYISAEIWPFLQKMLDDANAAGVDIKVVSAYRSFGTQSVLKSSYAVTYGSGANKFSADQGYSEHQLGTTVDFTTTKLGDGFTSFEKAAGYTWLTENAYKYGFVLSYQKNNRYYVFEPWHWRFVGRALAQKLHNENKNFYDLAQREIDEYLVSLFDQ
ncbi:MAG: M15 family metallopeptidase [Patescibacteria group bacterium]